MFPQVYIIVDADLGWDNVVAAFDNKEAAKEFYDKHNDGHMAMCQISVQSKFVEE